MGNSDMCLTHWGTGRGSLRVCTRHQDTDTGCCSSSHTFYCFLLSEAQAITVLHLQFFKRLIACIKILSTLDGPAANVSADSGSSPPLSKDKLSLCECNLPSLVFMQSDHVWKSLVVSRPVQFGTLPVGLISHTCCKLKLRSQATTQDLYWECNAWAAYHSCIC